MICGIRAHRQDERALLFCSLRFGDPVLRQRLAGVSEGGDAELYVPCGPRDGRNGQRAVDEGLADGQARGRSVQCAAYAKQRSDLGRSPPRLEIAIFVEERFLGPIVIPERCPIDLAAEERLRVEVAAPGQRRTLQLTDRHAILVQDAQLEFVDDRAFRRVRLVDGQAKIATGGGAPPKAVAAAVAGGDSAHFSEAVAVIGEMRRENGSVRLSPFDQRPERRSDTGRSRP